MKRKHCLQQSTVGLLNAVAIKAIRTLKCFSFNLRWEFPFENCDVADDV